MTETPPQRPVQYRLNHPLRVRWAEVDAQRVVFNGHYLMYADVCCTEYFRLAGLAQWNGGGQGNSGEVDSPDVLDPFVVSAALNYRSPARFDDLLTLRGRVSRLGNSSFSFECLIERGDTLLCRVETVSVNVHAGVPRPLPATFRAAVLAFQGEI